jgi:hypothetical protein
VDLTDVLCPVCLVKRLERGYKEVGRTMKEDVENVDHIPGFFEIW